MARRPSARIYDDHVSILMMAAWGLSPGAKAQRADEEPEDFVDRLICEMPEILVQAEGNTTLVAAVFGTDPGLIDDLISQVEDFPELRLAQKQGMAAAESRRKRSDETSIAIKEETLRQMRGGREKATRKRKWPDKGDPSRIKQIKKLLRNAAIEDYCGNVEKMAKPLQLAPREIQAVIDSDPELKEMQEIEESTSAALSRANLERLAATADSPAAAIKILTILNPERYSDRQKIEVTNKGFAPPAADEARPVNMLFAGKKEQDKCDED